MPSHRLNLARRALLRTLRDTVRVTGAPYVGQGVVDPVTLAVTYPEPDELYEGPGRVRNLAEILPGARVVVVDSEDYGLAGQEFEVRSVEPGGQLLTRRLQCRRLQVFPTVGGS